ncbi:MAG: family 78 glycoside hydrolase catalytic domain [Clostridia bacterium]|nr:family 78 glycoside hydrolase catalytic domain [Clostridia bacterium]
MVSDESWLTATHTGYSSCGIIGYETAFAERYDSSSKEVGFEKESFDDSQWQPASIYKQTDYILQKSPIQPLSVYLKKPIYTERKGEVLFVDFGQEMVGYLRAKAKGKQGDKVLLRFGEELNSDGSVRFDMRCNCRYEEEWILSGKEDVLDQFDYKAFRYCEIMIPEGASVRDVEMQVRHYPYEKKAVYETDNEQLRKVLQLCENTIKYGTQEVFVDCPTREKGQYLGDVCVSGRAQCVLTGDTTLIKKAIIDFCGSAFICKGVMAVSTSSFMQEIADYSLLLPALILWVYKRDNDKDFLRLTFPYITGVYEYFMQYSQEDGMIEGVKEKWNLVDWPDNLRDGYNFPLTKPIGPGKHNVLNAFWIGFLKAYQDICEILGEAVNIAIDNVEKSFINAFYNKETGLYCDSTQKTHSAVHSNVLPLLFNIGMSETKERKIVEYICQKKLTSMGVYMAYFTLAALMKHGEREKAELLATDKGAWLNMLEEGATTTFEAWGKNQKWNTSLFHPWATAPLIVFAKDTEVY